MPDTTPGDAGAERLKEYWAHGPGAAKIGWGAPGDWRRCVDQLSPKYMTPRQAKGYCNVLHHRALGIYPATHAAQERDS